MISAQAIALQLRFLQTMKEISSVRLTPKALIKDECHKLCSLPLRVALSRSAFRF
jgi:hypothetical protein